MGRKRGGHGGEGHASSERWLLTYADLITLLLAFFIIMYAMSETDAKKMEELARSLQSTFHLSSGGGTDAALPPASNDMLTGGGALLPEAKALMEIQEQLERELASQNGAEAAQSVTTSLNQRGLVISLANSAFFDSGEASLRPEARNVLKTVAGTLKSSKRFIMVEGHTDNTPINTARYPSNWELSTARATTVVRYLITDYGLPPKRLSAAGYGEYYPLVANTTFENRARNRRVDLVILRSDLKGQRPGGQL
ncbi:MAG: flagellar motor protein MotB [Candidatus Sericytochromatia bacterium]